MRWIIALLRTCSVNLDRQIMPSLYDILSQDGLTFSGRVRSLQAQRQVQHHSATFSDTLNISQGEIDFRSQELEPMLHFGAILVLVQCLRHID